MPQTETYRVRVGGDYACFSRPEFKVERVSYPVMTPSAARGILEAIFWKPEIRWEIRQIEVLNPIKQFSMLRNEVDEKQSQKQEDFVVEDRRQQRSSLVLKDVDYVVEAEMIRQPHATDPIPKYTSQFERRLERGQCHHTPYLGNREFAAWFEAPTGDEEPIDADRDIGQMLFDIAYIESDERQEVKFRKHDGGETRTVAGYTNPIFFDAGLDDGVLSVPEDMYETLYDLEGST